MRYLFFILTGVMFGVFFTQMGYLSAYRFNEHSGKIFFSMILIWILLTTAVTYFYKRKAQITYTTTFIIKIFCIMQIGFLIGSIIYPNLTYSYKHKNQHEHLEYKFAQLEKNIVIDFDEIYSEFNIKPNFLDFSYTLQYCVISFMQLILGFIPILLIKSKPTANV